MNESYSALQNNFKLFIKKSSKYQQLVEKCNSQQISINCVVQLINFNGMDIAMPALNKQVWILGLNFPEKGISGLKQKRCTFVCVHVRCLLS